MPYSPNYPKQLKKCGCRKCKKCKNALYNWLSIPSMRNRSEINKVVNEKIKEIKRDMCCRWC